MNRDLEITRVFEAPRELVWKAWTDPKHMARWWGPKDFTNPVCELDAQPGGAILIHMRGPDGTVYVTKGLFHEIVAPERLVFSTSAFEDAHGNAQLEGRTTVTFEDMAGKTKLIVRTVIVQAAPGAEGALAGMEEGWNESLDRLAEALS